MRSAFFLLSIPLFPYAFGTINRETSNTLSLGSAEISRWMVDNPMFYVVPPHRMTWSVAPIQRCLGKARGNSTATGMMDKLVFDTSVDVSGCIQDYLQGQPTLAIVFQMSVRCSNVNFSALNGKILSELSRHNETNLSSALGIVKQYCRNAGWIEIQNKETALIRYQDAYLANVEKEIEFRNSFADAFGNPCALSSDKTTLRFLSKCTFKSDSIAVTSTALKDDSQRLVDSVTLSTDNLKYNYGNGSSQFFTGGWFNVNRSGWNGRVNYDVTPPCWLMLKGVYQRVSGVLPAH